ncbi:MAG: ribonuclease domain-containing protein [Bacteroidota bacterium]
MGNTRVVFSDDGTGDAQEVQKNDYYAFGLAFETQENKYGYTFGHKEEQGELGLEWLDFGARCLARDMGRWLGVDILSENMFQYTVFGYAFNNPIRFSDPTGMSPDDEVEEDENKFDSNTPSIETWVVNKETNETIWIDDGHYFDFYVDDKDFKEIKEANSLSPLNVGWRIYNNWAKEATATLTEEGLTKAAEIYAEQLERIGPMLLEAYLLSRLKFPKWINVPKKVKKVLTHVRKNNGSPMAGYKGGKTFKNDGRGNGQVLPKKDQKGKNITYKEYDVNPNPTKAERTNGRNRGTERLVVGSDGSAYYTNDHYKTFKRIE